MKMKVNRSSHRWTLTGWTALIAVLTVVMIGISNAEENEETQAVPPWASSLIDATATCWKVGILRTPGAFWCRPGVGTLLQRGRSHNTDCF